MIPLLLSLLTNSLHPAAPAAAAGLARGPYVENVTRESAVVRWRNDSPSMAWLQYGPFPGCSMFTTISPTASEHAETLNGLLPDTTHCYRIYLLNDEGTATVMAGEGYFRTVRPPEQARLDFLIFGDSGSGSEEQSQVAGRMENFSPDFVIHTGDITETGLDADADTQFFGPYKNLLRKAPFYMALGNHDYGRYRKKPEGKDYIAKNYLPFHQMPAGPGTPYYYAFENADALFVCLDTNNAAENVMWAPRLDAGSLQLRWLESTLARSRARWKFVFLHHPVYASGGYGSTTGFDTLLAPIFEKNGVDLVFQGHDHNYERTFPVKNGERAANGVTYVTMGGGGRPLYIQRSQPDWSAIFSAVYSFAYARIAEKKFDMTAYDKDGQVIDTLQLSK